MSREDFRPSWFGAVTPMVSTAPAKLLSEAAARDLTEDEAEWLEDMEALDQGGAAPTEAGSGRIAEGADAQGVDDGAGLRPAQADERKLRVQVESSTTPTHGALRVKPPAARPTPPLDWRGERIYERNDLLPPPFVFQVRRPDWKLSAKQKDATANSFEGNSDIFSAWEVRRA